MYLGSNAVDTPEILDRNNETLFIIDHNMDILIGISSPTRRHLSLSRGKPVLGGGILVVEKGKVKEVKGNSGHYLFYTPHMKQSLDILKDKWVKLDSNVKVTNFINFTTKKILSINEFYDEAEREGKGNIMRINLRCVIIRNNKLLLCKNINKNFYFLPGGGLEDGETINQGIIREIKEELGIESDKIVIDQNINVIEHIFEDNGINYHEVNLIKNVYLDTGFIKSIEDHIEFTEVKISELHNYNILPLKIKKYILDKYVL